MIEQHFKSCGLKPHKPGTGKDGKRAVLEIGFHSLRHMIPSNDPAFAIFLAPKTCDAERLAGAFLTQLKPTQRRK